MSFFFSFGSCWCSINYKKPFKSVGWYQQTSFCSLLMFLTGLPHHILVYWWLYQRVGCTEPQEEMWPRGHDSDRRWWHSRAFFQFPEHEKLSVRIKVILMWSCLQLKGQTGNINHTKCRAGQPLTWTQTFGGNIDECMWDLL